MVCRRRNLEENKRQECENQRLDEAYKDFKAVERHWGYVWHQKRYNEQKNFTCEDVAEETEGE